MIHVIKLCNKMSQLLVTSAPVIYISPPPLWKESGWDENLKLPAQSMGRQASWWVQWGPRSFIRGKGHPSTLKCYLGVMQIRQHHLIWHMVKSPGLLPAHLLEHKHNRKSCELPSQTEGGALPLPGMAAQGEVRTQISRGKAVDTRTPDCLVCVLPASLDTCVQALAFE